MLLLLSAGGFVRQPGWPAAAFYLDPILLEFLFGMLIYRSLALWRPMQAWLALLLATLAIGALIVFPLPGAGWRVIAQGVPAAVIVFSFASLERYFDRVPSMLLFLGDASYVLYLVHTLVIELVVRVLLHRPMLTNWLALLLCLVVSILLACLLRQYLELPLYGFLRTGADRWMARRSARPSSDALKRLGHV